MPEKTSRSIIRNLGVSGTREEASCRKKHAGKNTTHSVNTSGLSLRVANIIYLYDKDAGDP